MELTFPRVSLAHLPTPLEAMPASTRALAGPQLFVKRDDCTGLALGGNKTRKLEFALGDALAKGADTILTSGGLQSNHVRQTAAACARLGLGCHAVVANPLARAPAAYRESGNQLLDRLLGAVVHEVPDGAGATEARLAELARALSERGARPYVVPLGASDGIGALGYVECARELVEQCRAADVHPTHVFLATGSCGTHAGLLAGLRLHGSGMQVIGVAVSETASAKRAKVLDVVRQVGDVLGRAAMPVDEGDVVVFGGYVGAGYGLPTEAGAAALERVARAEGLLLDPVYTAKAMAGMLDLLAGGRLRGVRDPVFLHTGGTPALFAYA